MRFFIMADTLVEVAHEGQVLFRGPRLRAGSSWRTLQGMTTYVDVLSAPDYLVTDSLSFDDSFWAANQVALNVDAARYGKELSPRTAPPNYSPTYVTSMTQFDALMQLTDTGPAQFADRGSAPGVSSPTSSSPISGAAVAVVAILGSGALIWGLSRV